MTPWCLVCAARDRARGALPRVPTFESTVSRGESARRASLTLGHFRTAQRVSRDSATCVCGYLSRAQLFGQLSAALGHR